MAWLRDTVSSISTNVNSIGAKVESVWNKVKDIPGGLLNAARHRSQPVVAVGEKAATTLASAKDSVLEAFDFLVFWVGQYQTWNATPFRAQLSSFLDDVFQLPAEAARIFTDVEFDVPDEIAKTIVEKMPKATLFGLSQGLDTMPKWQQSGRDLLAAAQQAPSLSEANDQLCVEVLEKEDLQNIIRRAEQLCSVLIPTLELAIRHLPRDASVGVSVLGEGACAEIAGHPAKLPLEWAKWAVELADKAFTRYLTFYDTCEAKQAAGADAAWKTDVTERLTRIEKMLKSSAE